MQQQQQPLQLLCVYTGRFSPPHRGHQAVYRHLVEAYAEDAVYIMTAEPKKPDERSPFTFEQKKDMLIAADIPASKIVLMKGNGYNADHIAASVEAAKTISMDRPTQVLY